MTTRRVALTAVGTLVVLTVIPLQLYRTTVDPMPPWASPLLWLDTLGCLSGGAWLLVWARGPGRSGRGPAPEPER